MTTASVPIANIKNCFCFSESGSPLHDMVIKDFLSGYPKNWPTKPGSMTILGAEEGNALRSLGFIYFYNFS